MKDTDSTKPPDRVSKEVRALAREQFSDDDIRQCLQELQNADGTPGLELKDFIADVERMLEQP